MFLPADLLWAVDHNLFNQLIYRSGVQLLQIGIPVGKLEETPHIGNLSGFIFNFSLQRSCKLLNFRLLRFILCRKFLKAEVAQLAKNGIFRELLSRVNL